MKKSILLFGILLSINYCFPAEIHTPSEILKLLTDSKVKYSLSELKDTVAGVDYSKKLNYHNSYRVLTDSTITTESYQMNDKAKPLFDKAEKFFKTNPDSARYYYNQALEADPGLFFIITYIAQTYEQKGDLRNAMEFYKFAISKNYIDYMAHWFLADAYFATGDINNAVDEIVIARILNRNNVNIKNSMSKIFKKAKRSDLDWYFTPQVKINQKEDGVIDIAYGSDWIIYALAKALWGYEPGYPESMGEEKGVISTIEIKECIISLVLSLENTKNKSIKDPQLLILKEAAKNNYLNEYIIYEIYLPNSPVIAYQLPEKSILKIKDYILKIRNK
jgi:tetratricopeptide (TPR) repeat protein